MSKTRRVSTRQAIERDVFVVPESLAAFCSATRQIGIEVVAVDEQDVIGLCESCGIPILDGDEHCRDDEDGIVLCKACAEELAQEAA